jgi:hypothetical protein
LEFHLDAVESASLQTIAEQWLSEVTPIRSQMATMITSFHGSFPNGRLGPGIDPTPPPALAELRAQIDIITLRYRDQLRNALPEADFQSLQTKVRRDLGKAMTAPAVQGSNGGNVQ